MLYDKFSEQFITMADYWVSQARKYCDFCKCWITDNKPSVQYHESGKKHKQNVEIRLKEIGKKSLKDQKNKQQIDKDMKQMEKEALKAYLKDIEQNPDYTSQVMKEKCANAKSIQVVTEKNQVVAENKRLWYEAKSEEGHTYYWHIGTGESNWDIPNEGFVSLAEQQKLDHNKEAGEKKVDPKKKEKRCKIKPAEKLKKKTQKEKKDEGVTMGPQNRSNPYGTWETVDNSVLEPVDFELPQQESIPILVPSLHESEPKITFKEKTIESAAVFKRVKHLDEEETNIGVQFKRRKLASVNRRQRLDND